MGSARITVVGAGAIGGLLAGALIEGGQQVSILARGATLAALRSNGLTLIGESTAAAGDTGEDPSAQKRLPVASAAHAAELGVQDIVVIAVKAQALPAMAPSLGPLVGPDTLVIAAVNGLPWWFSHGFEGPLEDRRIDAVDPAGVVSTALPPAQSLGCVVHLSASRPAPAVVRRGRGNHLIVGSPRLAHEPRVEAFAAALRTGGFDVKHSKEIRRDIWIKLWGNMNMNPLSALTGSTADRILDDPFTEALILRMMEEADTLGERLGLDMGMTAHERVAIARQLGPFKTSMLQDLEAGRALEIDPILGIFPELGRKLGIPTPFCDAVLGLLRQRAFNSGLSA